MRNLLTIILAPFLGHVLTPAVARELLDAVPIEGQPLPIAAIPRSRCGSFDFQCERVARIMPELEELHRLQWLETEKYRHGVELRPDVRAGLLDEQNGSLLQVTARRDGVLVGHLRWYITKSRHTSLLVAQEDTWYLRPEARVGRTQIRFLDYALDCLRHFGVREATADAKLTNGTARLLEHQGWNPVATKFHKIL